MNGPAVGDLVPVDAIDMALNPSGPSWIPQWVVECGANCEVGIAIDDHCYVVLVKDWFGNWKPTTHMPREVVAKLAEVDAHN